MVSRAISGLALTAALTVGLAAGVTWGAFSDATAASGNTFSAAASFVPQFVQQLGTATCGGGTSSVAAPATGAAEGNTVVATLSLRGAVDGAVTVTDSRGNSYVQDADIANGIIRTLVFSARLATALAPGDTITADHPFSDDAQAFAAAEFSGITGTDDVQTATGNGTTAGATVTTQSPNAVLVAAVSNPNSRVYSDDAGWTALSDVTTECGGGRGRSTLHSAYRLASSPGAWPYGATLNVPDRWGAAVVAYRP